MTIIKKFETAEPKKDFGKKYISLIAVCLFVLVFFQIWTSNSVVTYGEKLENLLTLQRTLNLENQILENKIAKQEALSSVASKSAELGFSEPESIQYIR